MSFQGEVIGNLVGAFVGAFLGYWLGVQQEKKSRVEREESRVKTMIESILQESDFNSEIAVEKGIIRMWSTIVGKKEDKEVFTHDDLWINELSTAVLESIMSSGNFSTLEPSLQVNLSILLMELKKVNRDVNRIEMQLPMKKNQLLKRKKQIDDSLDGVLHYINEVKESMQEAGYHSAKELFH